MKHTVRDFRWTCSEIAPVERIEFKLHPKDLRNIHTVFEFFKNRDDWEVVELLMFGEVELFHDYLLDKAYIFHTEEVPFEVPKIRVTNYDMVYIVLYSKHDPDNQIVIPLKDEHYE